MRPPFDLPPDADEVRELPDGTWEVRHKRRHRHPARSSLVPEPSASTTDLFTPDRTLGLALIAFALAMVVLLTIVGGVLAEPEFVQTAVR